MEPQKFLLLVASADELKSALGNFLNCIPSYASSNVVANQATPATPGGAMVSMVPPGLAKPGFYAGKSCPACGSGKVLVSKFKEGAFYCSNFKNGCSWKHNA